MLRQNIIREHNMYIPKHYAEENWEQQESLIKANPLGTVVSSGENGIIANHIPFYLHIDKDTNKKYLQGHIAKVNHQIPSFKEEGEVLIIFQSPSSYISPSYYPSKHETHKFVPTWDFASMHCYGISRVIDDSDWVRAQLNNFTDQQEIKRSDPWKVSDAPENYVKLKQKAITGLEIEITRIECKFKFEQEKKKQDIDGVVEGLNEDNKPEIAQYVREANETS